jgi:hypothetical protein
MSKGDSLPSAKVALPPSIPWTTWADVSPNPSLEITNPDPAPSGRRPPGTRLVTRRLATEGVSRSATEVTTRE